MEVPSFLHQSLFLYSGYLIWGYCLAKWDTRRHLGVIVLGGFLGIALTFLGVVHLSLEKGVYSFARFNSYKTLNTVLVATMVFCLVKHYAHKIPTAGKAVVAFVSRFSLGLFLVHPLLLWPVRVYGLYWGYSGLMIAFWTLLNTVATLLVVWLMSKNKLTHWMVP